VLGSGANVGRILKEALSKGVLLMRMELSQSVCVGKILACPDEVGGRGFIKGGFYEVAVIVKCLPWKDSGVED
jgi:hypothetical protein